MPNTARVHTIPTDSKEYWNLFDYLGNRIRDGYLVAFPTETVYGLGGNTFQKSALLSIFSTKERPLTDPLISHVNTVENALSQVLDLAPEAECIFRTLAHNFWPGPLSIIGKARPWIPLEASAFTGNVAVRCPNNKHALALIQSAGVPISGPSANKFGHISPTSAEHVRKEFSQYDLDILDDGECSVGLESTVVRIEELPEGTYPSQSASVEGADDTVLSATTNACTVTQSTSVCCFNICILRIGQISKERLEAVFFKAETPLISTTGKVIQIRSIYFSTHFQQLTELPIISSRNKEAFLDYALLSKGDDTVAIEQTLDPIATTSPPVDSTYDCGVLSNSTEYVETVIAPSGTASSEESVALSSARATTDLSSASAVQETVGNVSPGMLLTHYAPNVQTYFILPPESAVAMSDGEVLSHEDVQVHSKRSENKSFKNGATTIPLGNIPSVYRLGNHPRLAEHSMIAHTATNTAQPYDKVAPKENGNGSLSKDASSSLKQNDFVCRINECIMIDIAKAYKRMSKVFLGYFSLCEDTTEAEFERAAHNLFKTLHLAEEDAIRKKAKAILVVYFPVSYSSGIALAVFDRLYRSTSSQFVMCRMAETSM